METASSGQAGHWPIAMLQHHNAKASVFGRATAGSARKSGVARSEPGSVDMAPLVRESAAALAGNNASSAASGPVGPNDQRAKGKPCLPSERHHSRRWVLLVGWWGGGCVGGVRRAGVFAPPATEAPAKCWKGIVTEAVASGIACKQTAGGLANLNHDGGRCPPPEGLRTPILPPVPPPPRAFERTDRATSSEITVPIAGIVPVFNLSVTRLRCQRPLFHSRALPVKELFETTAGPELRGGQRLQSHGRRVLGGGGGGGTGRRGSRCRLRRR